MESYGGIVAAGKEAIVIHASGGDSDSALLDGRLGRSLNESNQIPAEMAVKVFKTTLNEFRTRDKYIQDDYRFKGQFVPFQQFQKLSILLLIFFSVKNNVSIQIDFAR